MARIVRCPACGALWRLTDDQLLPSTLRCSECSVSFAAQKAEILTVPDERLQARLATQPVGSSQAQEGENTMLTLVDELKDFDARRALPEKTSSSSLGWLWWILGFIALALLCLLALLITHRQVLAAIPAARPIYENVCRQLPCPGFVWAQPQAFTVAATLEEPGENAPQENAPYQITLQLTNTSHFPQLIPTVEIKLLDQAGDTIAQRIVDASDLGLTDTSISPSATKTIHITIDTPLPYAPASVKAAPIALD